MPVILPRAEHPISRRAIDADALRVLYRLQHAGHLAYLVGGGVRDLLLNRHPKDFDVGTDAHPGEIKKLFRNCWIIGRRFRLAHVRFGNKTIEVATFRRHVLPGTENEPATTEESTAEALEPRSQGQHAVHVRHDDTFGSPEEDAFRRDFTINALFYDIATFSIIDYVGGLEDLRSGVIRSIGDPRERFHEDPVRMLRAIAFAARLDFRLDEAVVAAMATHGALIATAAPARLIEEYYKVLRSGAAEKTFRLLSDHGLLEAMTPELHRGAREQAFWRALQDLDRYRQRFSSVPEGVSNAVLLGTLLVPLGLMPARTLPDSEVYVQRDDGRRFRRLPKEPPLRLGMLPVARRDTERLRQLLSLQRRLLDLESSPRAKRALVFRPPFAEALVWLEIHGHAPETSEHWRGFVEALQGERPSEEAPVSEGDSLLFRRRRRGRRRGRRGRSEFEQPS